MIEVLIVRNFLVALALGALIGLEREYAKHKERGHDYAGIRTFPLIALYGAVSAFFAEMISVWIILLSIVLTGTLIIIAYFLVRRKEKTYFGITSEMAGFLTFFIGMLSYYNELTLAVTLAVVITIILFMRSILHKFAEQIKHRELADTLKFAVVAFIILPFLPNQGYGPLDIFNPFIVWLMVVFISSISFIGYIFMKWLGEKGIKLAGIVGGLISSTLVTTNFAERSKKTPGIYLALVLGVILANGIMFVRILIEVFVLNQNLFLELFLAFSILIIITVIFSYFLWKKAKKEIPGQIKLESPFTLGPALKFGAFFAVILALVKIANVYFSSNGVYVISFISGFANVDAITVSLSQLAKTTVSEKIARNSILLAALTNMAVKGSIAYWLGGKKFGRIILSFFIVLIITGILLIFLL